MELISGVFDLFLNLDVHLRAIIQTYGVFTYAIIFVVIFCETGLVVTPFLPGDSLLFAAGTFAAQGSLDPAILCILIPVAALCGDNTNYWIGRHIGPKVFSKENVRLLNKKHLERTQSFYEKYGGKTIIIARFMPIIRTFAPFVAGIGKMRYVRFLGFSIGGAILWACSFVLGGYFFGNIPVVKENFTITIMVIILISVMPGVIEYLRHRFSAKKTCVV